MVRKFVVKANKTVAKRKPVKAATSAEMLSAFQDRLADFGVESKTDIECRTVTRDVIINDSDYDEYFTDENGGFGDPGEVYSLGEIKQYWNSNSNDDPILADYPDFESWWAETYNLLTPYYGDY